MSKIMLGVLLALSAAALNASIGIFSKVLLQNGLIPQDIAFFKTVCAFVILSLILINKPLSVQKKEIINAKITSDLNWLNLLTKIAICAFLGIFVLFFFETTAYQYGFASNVVVVLMASASVFALLFGRMLLNEKITIAAILGTLLAIVGIFLISWSGGSNLTMLLNAIIAGSGYGVFSVLVKKFSLNGGIYLTRLFMMFGGVYLFFPYLNNRHHIDWNALIVMNVLALALLPTILGFYCTTKALNYLTAAKVQVTELSEPIFAVVMAWVFLHELPTHQFFVGAIFIVMGIVLINQMHQGLLSQIGKQMSK